MKLIYHRSVQGDVSAVLTYYDEVGGTGLGDAFFEEFMAYVALALENPTRFHPIEGDLRRANLDRFPYHFLYRIHGDTIRILVVRHHHRDPSHGLRRTWQKKQRQSFLRAFADFAASCETGLPPFPPLGSVKKLNRNLSNARLCSNRFAAGLCLAKGAKETKAPGEVLPDPSQTSSPSRDMEYLDPACCDKGDGLDTTADVGT